MAERDGLLLEARDLKVGYVPEVNIVNGCDVELRRGELVSIIGPNGAGKSTLIKGLFGLVPVRGGTVRFKGEDVTNAPTYRLVEMGIGYVPQTENVFPSLTVEENLEMGAFLNPKVIKDRYEVIFEWFPMLRDRRGQRAGTMSGGQRQLVALARALMLEPDVLFLDEPSAGLSPSNVDLIFERIRFINSEGVAILMVEQNARRALAMSDRGYVLEMGRNRFSGPGRELLNDPKVVDLYLGGRASGGETAG
ncbi:ABC transporter ATP-binding protein [Rubrobacter taiwanensis]|uniref:ABC transporter ATP-binding protein n=1 Tax=Rubrobacter taiwanensis TaxID=185139 RepID=A0A4R1BS54_9ACTN|nr:ABC transporter ATP-binding protein [Rubrobacter taiwanensis]TCJ20055.1 ABC transporter ATP-binding protein [Rubrobacter taiwanensis]